MRSGAALRSARPASGGFSRHGLSTRGKRLALVAGYAAAPEALPRMPEEERRLAVSRPGELVQTDCFCIGRLAVTNGIV